MSQYKITNLTNGTLSFAAGSTLGPGASRLVSKVTLELKRLEQRGFVLLTAVADDATQLPPVSSDTDPDVKPPASSFSKADLTALLASDLDVRAAVAQASGAADKASTSAVTAAIAAAIADKITLTALNNAITAAIADKVTTAALSAAIADRPTASTVSSAIAASVSDRATVAALNAAIAAAIADKITTTALTAALADKASNLIAAALKAASYTTVLSDAGGVAIEMNVATANTVTVPPNSAVAYPIGAVLEVFQAGTGQTTIVAGAGVTIRTSTSLALRTQYASCSLRKRGTDEWVLSGDMA